MSFTTDTCAEIPNMLLTAHISKHTIVPKSIMKLFLKCYAIFWCFSSVGHIKHASHINETMHVSLLGSVYSNIFWLETWF